MIRVKNPQDFWAGLLFLAVGCLALWFGRTYAFGTATRMGPGYMPTVLSWGLVLIGAFLSLRAFALEGPPIERSLFRPQVFILLAIIVFGLLIERVGLAPAIAVVTVVAALASHEMRWRETLAVAVGLAALCVGLFIHLLGQPLTIWTWGF
jgi:Tripartite tricarboxylate transporter TctB family